jgi:sigma-B regulation protein RsbU (phosphoserine phosphatase)
MPTAAGKLEIYEDGVRRIVPLDKDQTTLGRLEGSDVQVVGADVSRKHAEILRQGDGYVVRDLESRFGTFVNDQRVQQQALSHGDRLRLGPGDRTEIHFLIEGADSSERSTHTSQAGTGFGGDLRQITVLLEGLRALGSGRVLEEVLAIVLDSAISLVGADRGFVMLATPEGVLEFKLARSRGGATLAGEGIVTSRKVPEEVFTSGQPQVKTDLTDPNLGGDHQRTLSFGIRAVMCVPLRLARFGAGADASAAAAKAANDDVVFGGGPAARIIGVLYLDSQVRAGAASTTTIGALEALAGEAAVAIESARLYREAVENAHLKQDMDFAREVQRALLPPAEHVCEGLELAGVTVPCREIGGDFFDYFDVPGGHLGIALADVTGHGASAALLAAKVQGILSSVAAAQASAAAAVHELNAALTRRAVPRRFATLAYVILACDGRLLSCNAGHNPPLVLRADGAVSTLEKGGLLLGQFDWATFEEETVGLAPGDTLLMYSDGLVEAADAAGEQFGETRLLECLAAAPGLSPNAILERLLRAVSDFTGSTVQADDITVVAVRFRGR